MAASNFRGSLQLTKIVGLNNRKRDMIPVKVDKVKNLRRLASPPKPKGYKV
jgi:hypothetical protein